MTAFMFSIIQIGTLWYAPNQSSLCMLTQCLIKILPFNRLGYCASKETVFFVTNYHPVSFCILYHPLSIDTTWKLTVSQDWITKNSWYDVKPNQPNHRHIETHKFLFIHTAIFFIIIIIIIISCWQHGYPWPSLATPPYRSSP